MISRDEYLAWAKQRALELVDAGDLVGAFASLGSDLRKHPELERHAGVDLGAMLILSGFLKSPDEMRKWIEGFN